jgi:hypothetical protein
VVYLKRTEEPLKPQGRVGPSFVKKDEATQWLARKRITSPFKPETGLVSQGLNEYLHSVYCGPLLYFEAWRQG